MGGRNKADEDFEDFSLSDETEDDKNDNDSDEAFSQPEESDADDLDADDDEPLSDEAGSDFDDEKPKAKRGKAAGAKGKAATAAKPKRNAKPAAAAKPKKAAAVPKATAKTATPKTKPSPRASPGPSSSTPVIEAGDAESQVLDYMRRTNRPYSMLNVFENLHRAIAKPSLTRILDGLVDKEELVSKTYGKAKIYYMNQNKLPVPSEEERADVEQQIKQLEENCAALEHELKVSEAALSNINAQISDADLEATLERLETESKALQEKLEILERPDREPVSPGRKDVLKRKFNTYKTGWVKRKRTVVDAVNMIADGMEKKPKDVYDLCSIETDADVGIKEIPSI